MQLSVRKWNQTKMNAFFSTTTEGTDDNEQVNAIQAFGDDSSEKEEGTMRASAMNVHGLKLTGTELRELEVMKELSIDMFGISETNINATHDMRTELTKMIEQQLGGGVAVTSSHRSTKIGYLPGGTSLITQGPTRGRHERRIVDKMGRFSGQLLKGIQGSGVFQCSVYRVCQTKNAIVGSDTAFARQRDELRSQGVKIPDPRKQTLTD